MVILCGRSPTFLSYFYNTSIIMNKKKKLAKYIHAIYIFNFDIITLNKNNSVLFNTTNTNATVYT